MCTSRYVYVSNAVYEAVFWRTVRDELTKIKNSFVENVHSLPNLLIPFVIINAEFWQWYHKILKPRLPVTFIFPTCKKIYKKYEHWMKKLCHQSLFHKLTCQRNLSLTPLVGCVIYYIGRKKSKTMCQNEFFLCLQGIKMRKSKRKQMHEQLKRRYNSQRKN